MFRPLRAILRWKRINIKVHILSLICCYKTRHTCLLSWSWLLAVWACQWGDACWLQSALCIVFAHMNLRSIQAQFLSITWTRSLLIGGTKFRARALTSTWTRLSVNATWRYSTSVWRQCQVRERGAPTLQYCYEVAVSVVQHSGPFTASHFISRYCGLTTGFHFSNTGSCEGVGGPKCHVLSLWSNGKRNFLLV
jgi:hypothetical protein